MSTWLLEEGNQWRLLCWFQIIAIVMIINDSPAMAMAMAVVTMLTATIGFATRKH